MEGSPLESWDELTAPELAQRRPAWSALSELFLDTETRLGLTRGAHDLIESGYDEPMIRWIYAYEIKPVVGWNLLAPSGAWSGFDLDWLESEIIATRRRCANRGPLGILARVTQWTRARTLPNAEDFDALLAYRRALLGSERCDRDAMCTALQALTASYVDASIPPPLDRLRPLGPSNVRRLADEVVIPALAQTTAPTLGDLSRSDARDRVAKMISRIEAELAATERAKTVG